MRGQMKSSFFTYCLRIPAFTCTLAFSFSVLPNPAAAQQPVLTGQAAFTDAAHESPGIRRHLTLADLPAPAEDQSVDNGANIVPRPAKAWPIAPKGFKVELYATGLDNPRLLRTAPNGDLFLAESETGKIKVFRGVGAGRQSRSRSRSSPTACTSPSASRFIPAGPNPLLGLHRQHRRHRALPL